MTDPLRTTLTRLVETWREEAERGRFAATVGDRRFDYLPCSQLLLDCADDLEAALKAEKDISESGPKTSSESGPKLSGGWQPVVTAPKDGTMVLLAWEHGIVIAAWNDNAAFPQCEKRPGWEVNDIDGDCWFSFSLEADQPTHWMPLPSPPSEAEPSVDEIEPRLKAASTGRVNGEI